MNARLEQQFELPIGRLAAVGGEPLLVEFSSVVGPAAPAVALRLAKPGIEPQWLSLETAPGQPRAGALLGYVVELVELGSDGRGYVARLVVSRGRGADGES